MFSQAPLAFSFDRHISMSFPAGRMQPAVVAPKPFNAMLRLEAAITIDHALRELVKLRASQINGCAFCIDMHWKDAMAGGESEERLYLLDAWRESTLYTDRERAALALCEAVTLITDGHVPDRVWNDARAVLDDIELANLLFVIATINAWNRLMIACRTEPGHYQPTGATTPRPRPDHATASIDEPR
jgi:AhpD family alkylhydroperoxidase